MLRKLIRWASALAMALSLAACPLDQTVPGDLPESRLEAWRFLSQATFGATEADVNHLSSVGYSAWIDEQLATPSAMSYRAYFEARDQELRQSGASASDLQVLEAFYTRAVTDPAQLRNRVALALSEIFVVSFVDPKIWAMPQLMVGYLDMLDRGVDGTYRELLGAVSTSPAMGQYLSFRSNAKENASIGLSPDENYAREILQLFSIGLYQLNPDGTLKLNANGEPIETYTNDDVKGLAKVFTGWGQYKGSAYASASEWHCFYMFPDCIDPEGLYQPMVPYPNYHSTSEKRFLGTTIAAQDNPDTAGDLRTALDAIASHPNTAPNFCRQLIQRLVTSNPSAAYVQRVSTRFLETQGSIKETVKAILLDVEARSTAAMYMTEQGKLREPVLRLTAVMRAFKVKSASLPDNGVTATLSSVPHLDMGLTSDAGASLGQTPFYSPSVFNFFRPGYVLPQSETAKLNLVAPEFQLVSETSVSGYVNTIKDLLTDGIGNHVLVDNVWQRGVRLDVSEQRALAYDAHGLVTHIADRLLGGSISPELSQTILDVLDTMPVPSLDSTQSNGEAINAALDQRARAAILLIAASPEFMIQR